MKIGFIGLGLIGGSLAKSIRETYKDCTIAAYDIYGKLLDNALVDGTINKACYEIDDNFSNCDYIFLCAPVTSNEENLKTIISYCGKNTILTDVGSTKGNIHRALDKIGFDGVFIGGHPMAGSEKYGYDHSGSNIIKGAYYVLTPGKNATDEQINSYANLVESIGCKPTIMDMELHDRATGVISHIPHVISASLVHFLINHDNDKKTMKALAAGGFRDVTRTASSSVKMWEDICLANNDIICELLDDYIEELKDIRNTMASKDKTEIARFFSEAKEYRDFLYENNPKFKQ
ncbi:MAG: prephenate dehydrogenase/arogenate dehydrogenase family protein [Lachnospiraceae bacterium]|nr:prephenate dehydrogenase/arogenate dehydrogenase family protein [Lachnospiraceae bacterium]